MKPNNNPNFESTLTQQLQQPQHPQKRKCFGAL